ncbi:MAG: ORC1-type DNA replication protein [Candidatus Hydrothermarchaeales archaeon]
MDLKTSFSGIFESLLQREPLFMEKEVLRHSYTPDELPHREKEIRQLATILAPVLRGDTPSNILIYGKSGTGKSITSRFICDELYKTGAKMDIPVDTVFLNCEITDTQYRVLQSLAKQFGERIPFTGWPTDKVYKTFIEAVDRRKRYIIIVLDEIDRLVANNGDSVIYNLTRINADLKNARVSIVGISNDLKFTSYLDARVQSSLGEEEIVFSPYNAKQLEDILNQRAERAFKIGVLNEYVIPLCAALAAREHGDARRALDLLRVSGEIAERECIERVTEAHVRKAKEKIESDHVVEVVRTLPTQSKLVLYAVILFEERGGGRITTGDVYKLYKSLCRRISLDTLTSRRVSDLILELDLLGIFDTAVVSKGRYGRTREITLEVPTVGIRLVIEDDVRLRPLLDFKVPQRALM